MEIYIARQPIFDKNMHVFAYELLYRSGTQNVATADGDSATSTVIINSMMLIGLENLTDQKKAFVNFTYNLLVNGTATVFDPNLVVVEVLENIAPDPKLLTSLDNLKSAGFTIALDDYVADYHYEDIVERSDIIKVDFMLSTPDEIRTIAKRFAKSRIQLLAEKVETYEQFKEAVQLGYTYFQGYFFSKPNIVSTKDVQGFQVSQVQILNELNAEEPDIRRIADIIEKDLALSYKLLRLVNSAAYYSKTRIASIQQALVRVGLKEIRKWIMLIMLRDAGKDKPEELVRISLIRGRTLELMAPTMKLKNRSPELFLVGLFSMIDTILSKPMTEIVEELPFEQEIKAALLGEHNVLNHALELFVAYEQGNWEKLKEGSNLVSVDAFAKSYYEALAWTREIFAGDVV